jgi:hypothetical protein
VPACLQVDALFIFFPGCSSLTGRFPKYWYIRPLVVVSWGGDGPKAQCA